MNANVKTNEPEFYSHAFVLQFATICNNKNHSAVFPEELPEWFIKLFTQANDWVLDPFLGSGSTLIASYLHGRKGIGVDIDEKYCNIAIERLHNEAKVN